MNFGTQITNQIKTKDSQPWKLFKTTEKHLLQKNCLQEIKCKGRQVSPKKYLNIV